MKKRNENIDIIKGIGIILMVCGHADAPFTHFIYLFHMAIFFIASGYCFKEKNSQSFLEVKKFVIRRFKGLWFPYVLWMSIFSILNNFFIKINVYTNNKLLLDYCSNCHLIDYWTVKDMVKNILKSFLLHGSTQMGAAFWFIATLMGISVSYCLIDFILKIFFRGEIILLLQGIVSATFLFTGFVMSIYSIECGGLDRILSFYSLFYLGIFIRNIKIMNNNTKMNCMISFVILLIGNNLGSIALNENQYMNPFYLIVVSLAGWFFLYGISDFFKKNSFLKKIIVCVGRNSLAIVILHFLSFKIINLIAVVFADLPYCLIAAFPVLCRGGAWWFAYSVVGVFIPVLASIFWKKMKSVWGF